MSRTRRVPIRFQLTKTECGAACLAMVLSYYGRRTSVPEARNRLEAGRDGVSVKALTQAAESFGLDVTVDRTPDAWAAQDAPNTPNTPAIAYLARYHFVVLTKVTDRHVHFIDPGSGRRRMSRADFGGEYGGVLVRLAPGAAFEKVRTPVRTMPMVRYLRQFVAVPGGRRRLALAALLAAGLQVLGLGAPLATKIIVDSVIPGEHTGTLGLFVLGSVVLALLCGVLTAGRALALLALRVRGDRKLTRDFVEHLFALPLGFFSDRGRGDLLMRLSSVSSARESLTQQLLTTVLDGFLLSGYVAGLIVTAPVFALAVLPLFAAELGLVMLTYRKTRMLAQRELATKTEEQSYLVEALHAVSALKANGIENRATSHWCGLFDVYQAASARRGRWSAWLGGGQRTLGVFGPLALLWLGAWLVLTHRLSVGGMLAANGVALAVLGPIESIAASGQMYQGIRAQVERLFDVLDTPRERAGGVRLAASGATGFTLAGVTYRYPGDAAPALDGVTLEARAGQKIAIVGRTGSGKSTLGQLILGLLEPDSGEIRHDGVPIGELDLADLRGHCGAVLQELTLFDGSIRENITLGRPGTDPEAVLRAARLAGLHEDVLALPLGYDTSVGEGGSGLSAGQRQRVALARAVVHRPSLLLLDEATSHLDPGTERRVDRALGELDVTRVVISHRGNAVRDADQIIVLDRGRIVQHGTHPELLAADGVYRDLFAAADQAPAFAGNAEGR